MKVGETRKLVIPGHEGYGAGVVPAWGITPNATLEFTLEASMSSSKNNSIKKKGGGGPVRAECLFVAGFSNQDAHKNDSESLLSLCSKAEGGAHADHHRCRPKKE